MIKISPIHIFCISLAVLFSAGCITGYRFDGVLSVKADGLIAQISPTSVPDKARMSDYLGHPIGGLKATGMYLEVYSKRPMTSDKIKAEYIYEKNPVASLELRYTEIKGVNNQLLCAYLVPTALVGPPEGWLQVRPIKAGRYIIKVMVTDGGVDKMITFDFTYGFSVKPASGPLDFPPRWDR